MQCLKLKSGLFILIHIKHYYEKDIIMQKVNFINTHHNIYFIFQAFTTIGFKVISTEERLMSCLLGA